MKLFPHFVQRFASTAAAVGIVMLTACAGSTPGGPSDPALVVFGSGAPLTEVASFRSDSDLVFGGASSLTIKIYALYISSNGDCSNPVLVQDLGSAGVDKDFMTNPVLFEGEPAEGSYDCLMLDMSDMLHMRPATSFGACVAGQDFGGDIYHEGESDWKDVHLNPLVGTGTNEVPAADRVTIFITRDTSAALARGISSNQTVPLASSLVVPGQSTFHIDASNAVATNGVECGLEPPRFSFR